MPPRLLRLPHLCMRFASLCVLAGDSGPAGWCTPHRSATEPSSPEEGITKVNHQLPPLDWFLVSHLAHINPCYMPLLCGTEALCCSSVQHQLLGSCSGADNSRFTEGC
ncbi:hypothetical protein E2C01_091870 [Portunus trituberculatus]|uniref:Secreted protein n=1 Tax=Portunus trituberculatus TaxID=210409 RepID=A0A5B7JK62_PORTR|nr:hypothetical protein [Portunus trituberculatus]